jgi:hypothetical protein
MNIEAIFGTVGTLAGLLAALGIFVVAARLVMVAQRQNRRLRAARHDPHFDPSKDKGRDIPR